MEQEHNKSLIYLADGREIRALVDRVYDLGTCQFEGRTIHVEKLARPYDALGYGELVLIKRVNGPTHGAILRPQEYKSHACAVELQHETIVAYYDADAKQWCERDNREEKMLEVWQQDGMPDKTVVLDFTCALTTAQKSQASWFIVPDELLAESVPCNPDVVPHKQWIVLSGYHAWIIYQFWDVDKFAPDDDRYIYAQYRKNALFIDGREVHLSDRDKKTIDLIRLQYLAQDKAHIRKNALRRAGLCLLGSKEDIVGEYLSRLDPGIVEDEQLYTVHKSLIIAIVREVWAIGEELIAESKELYNNVDE